jgi:hypothetical protein
MERQIIFVIREADVFGIELQAGLMGPGRHDTVIGDIKQPYIRMQKWPNKSVQQARFVRR